MKTILIVLTLLASKFICAQQNFTLVTGFPKDYKMVNNKIFEVTTESSSKQIGTIRGNKIYKGTSLDENDVLFTVLDEKAYKTSVIADSTLIFYIKANEIFLRTKKGNFESAGIFRKSTGGGIGMISYLDPIEYFALLIAAKRL